LFVSQGNLAFKTECNGRLQFDAIWPSAGITAGMDLALARIEDNLGRDIARSPQVCAARNERRNRHLVKRLTNRETRPGSVASTPDDASRRGV